MKRFLLKNRKGVKNTILFKYLLIVITFYISGCSSTQYVTKNKPRYLVKVDAYGNDNYLHEKKYILVPSDSTINTKDLQYIVFSDMIKKSLSQKGYIEATKPDEANVAIFFKYGISNPKTFHRTISLPQWGETGISSTNTSGSVEINPFSNNINYNQKTSVTPSYGITGMNRIPLTIVQYLRYLTLTAYDLDEYKKNGDEKIIWNMVITSIGRSGDLRRVFPYLLVAGETF